MLFSKVLLTPCPTHAAHTPGQDYTYHPPSSQASPPSPLITMIKQQEAAQAAPPANVAPIAEEVSRVASNGSSSNGNGVVGAVPKEVPAVAQRS